MQKNLTRMFLGLSLIALTVFAMPASQARAFGDGQNIGQNQEARIAKIKSKAGEEITRRIDALNKLIARVGEMKKLSDVQKSSITTMAQTNITDLTALKAKIDADTDLAVLKTDRQGITKSYRIFMLIIPKGHIFAAADRTIATVTLMQESITKLQVRITAAQTAGKDVTAFSASITDMQAKLADATTQANAAVALVTPLVPDQGVQAQIDANKVAIESARKDIKVAVTDLKAARADAESIRTGLKAMGF